TAAGPAVVSSQVPLRAQLRYTLNHDLSVPSALPFAACSTLCLGDDIFLVSGPAEGWRVYAHLVVSWRYSTPAGQLVLHNGPAALPASETHVAVLLSVRWQEGPGGQEGSGGQWQVQMDPEQGELGGGPQTASTPVCHVAGQLLEQQLVSPRVDTTGTE